MGHHIGDLLLIEVSKLPKLPRAYGGLNWKIRSEFGNSIPHISQMKCAQY